MEKNNQTSVIVTSRNFIEIYNPDLLSRQLDIVRSVNDALVLSEEKPDEYPPLVTLKQKYGPGKVEALIKLYLVDFCEMVNLKRPLTERQIDVIAAEVMSQYYNLTIPDVHLIFRKARNGEYGELFESLDVPKVMKWFSTYFNDRCNVGEQLSLRESDKHYDKGGNMTPSWMRKCFDGLEQKFKHNKK